MNLTRLALKRPVNLHIGVIINARFHINYFGDAISADKHIGQRPVSAVLLIVMIVVFGFSSYCSLEQELTPEME